MPEPAQSLLNNLISFTAKSAVTGSTYGGSIELTNDSNQYTDALRWTQMQVALDAAVLSDLTDDSCFAGDVTWLNGVIHEVSSAYGLSRNAVSLKLQSYFSAFKRKAVNSERYDDSVSLVMSEIATIFGGIPSSLIDFSDLTSSNVYAVVSGNNLLAELQKLANVGLADLYVNRGGIMVTGSWKDGSSTVDHVIDDAAIISATRGVGSGSGPSRFIVRGRFISTFEAGESVLSAGGDNKGQPRGNDPSKQGQVRKCTRQGVGSATNRVKIKNLSGDDPDVRNSRVTTASGSQSRVSRVVSSGRGEMVVEIESPTGGDLGQGDSEIELDVRGERKPKQEYEDPNSKQRPLRENISDEGYGRGNMGRSLQDLPVAQYPKNEGGKDSDKASDEPDPIRIEMWVNDPDLQNEFGVVTQQVDNLYASDMDTLFELGIRKCQEFKMARRTWQVNTKYLPCLEVNDVVTFTTPDDENTVTGRLTQITVKYSGAGPKADMALAIQSFEDIGSTSYTSGNLLLYADMVGVNGVNWVGSGAALMMNGYVALADGGSISQGVNLEGGISHTVTFSLKKASGGSLTFSVPGSSVLQSYASGGDFTITFTASAGLNNFTWTSSNPSGWYMHSPIVRKTVTR
jgi:hypothetical protein